MTTYNINPSPSYRQSIRTATYQLLSSNNPIDLPSAQFLAERLCTERWAEDEDYKLLGTILFRSGQYEAAVDILDKMSNHRDMEAIFLKATALHLTNRTIEAKRTLLLDNTLTLEDIQKEIQDMKTTSVPGGASGLLLLGILSESTVGIVVTTNQQPTNINNDVTMTDDDGNTSSRNQQPLILSSESAIYYSLVLQLNPYLFEARERLAAVKVRDDFNRMWREEELTTNTNNNSIHTSRNNQTTTTTTTTNSPPNEAIILLERFGMITEHQLRYECDEALRVLRSLPSDQQRTGYALHQFGVAHFEKAEFEQACSYFERMRLEDPHRVKGLELYSTALWHTKREVELAHLARFTAEHFPESPQTWCCVGNCLSQQKDHDLALRFFKRALQISDKFTYAYTLAGHEYVANEDFESALGCFRSALRVDPMHYNAWWGLGTIYFRREKYELAELHFRRAIAIHPRSSVLWCFLGMVFHATGKREAALKALDRARLLQPTNPQARFQRAHVLLAMNDHVEALKELEFVREAAPKEAMVHLIMGRIYKHMGHRDKAMIHFVAALDLDNKDAATVRAAIDELDTDGGGGNTTTTSSNMSVLNVGNNSSSGGFRPLTPDMMISGGFYNNGSGGDSGG
jgi:anaphase-promoting complex subunit 3